MKPLIIVFALGFFFFAACSDGEDSTEVVTIEPIATETQVSASPTPEPEDTPTGCVSLTPNEEKLREALQTHGNFDGDTVSIRLEGCGFVGVLTYESANDFAKDHPNADPSEYPNNPLRELREWAEEVGLDPDLGVQISWERFVPPSEEVCQALQPEGLRCK